MTDDLCQRFRDLHQDGMFVMPNPWDVGSARLLAYLGFPALATTSSGHAASLGRPDQHVSLDELVEHTLALVGAVDVPVNVDAEYGFADDLAGVERTVDRIAATGAAGMSIEDYNPGTSTIDPLGRAAERVAAAARAAGRSGIVLTARSENHLYGVTDVADTIARLVAYREAGADVLYAPGLNDLETVRHVAATVGAPINVLALPGGPSTSELASVGVRRVSTGGALAFAAYGELVRAARELLTDGTSDYSTSSLSGKDRAGAFS